MVKFWLKRDFTNCAYMSQSLYFIAKVASGVLLVVGLLFFPLFSSRPKKITLNVEVYGQVNSKAIYNELSPRKPDTQAKLCRVGQVNAESLACQRHRKQLEKDNNRGSCQKHCTPSDKSKLSKIPMALLSLR